MKDEETRLQQTFNEMNERARESLRNIKP